MVKKIKLTNESTFLMLVFPLFLMSSFNSNSNSLREIGILAILLLFAISVIFLIRHTFIIKAIDKYILKLLIPIVLLSVVLFLSHLVAPNFIGLSNIAKYFGAMFLFLFFSYIDWTEFRIKIIFVFSALMLLTMPFYTDVIFAGPHYAFLLFFVIMSSAYKWVKFILSAFCLYFIYLSDARAVLLLVAAFSFTYIIWKFITKNKAVFNFYIISILSALMAFIFIYPNLINYQWFQSLNSWFILNTGARLNSGRDIIWAKLTDVIVHTPYLGHGLGSSVSGVINENLSAHNLYLQISFQSGLIALAVYLILLITIWNVYLVSKHDRLTRLSASFFIGILIYSSFEVILLQNKMDTATMFWLIISIGISRTIYKNKTEHLN